MPGDGKRYPTEALAMLTSTAIFLGALAVPSVAYLFRRHLLRPEAEPLVFILACVVAYIALVVSIPVRRAEIEHAALAFDASDSSAQAEAARRRVSNDTGLTLAPITGLFIIPIWSLLTYTGLATIHWVATAFARIKNADNHDMHRSGGG
ncbi:membrane protein [Rhodopirellula sallentina SM41]|uniref:Membrane protein n=1 Tax=Rhodopirellula sallentina SM41 TaxID=1263870 RepID=M5U8X6_9BACT|nr:membrane protein [Rhodopirellula sallentina SM41]